MQPLPTSQGSAQPPGQGPDVKHAWTSKSKDKGIITNTCRITVTKDGITKAYIVTARYSAVDLQKHGYVGDFEETIKEVINASIDLFPKLAGASIAFNPDKPEETLITKHTIVDCTGKKIIEIKDKHKELYDVINRLSLLFGIHFADLKPPIKLEIEEDKTPASVPVQVDVEEENEEKKKLPDESRVRFVLVPPNDNNKTVDDKK